MRWTNADPDHPNYTDDLEQWRVNGAYAFYPVLTEDVLIEDCISIGSSDVGFYVGQSQDVVVRRNLAFRSLLSAVVSSVTGPRSKIKKGEIACLFPV